MRRKIVFIIILVVLTVSIGYAYLTQLLQMQGTVNIEPLKTEENLPIMAEESVFTSKISSIKEKTATITFNDQINIPENAIETADISNNQDGSVIAYWVASNSNSSLYDLHIEGKGALYANPNMNSYFKNFNVVTKIEGGDNLNTSLVTSMFHTFYGCSALTSLNTSNWDLSNVKSLYGTFYKNSQLESLGNTSEWDLTNVTNMNYTFYGCSSLKNLDSSNWNTINVQTFNSTFANCFNLEINGLSGIKFNSLAFFRSSTTSIDMSPMMFGKCHKLNGTLNVNGEISSHLFTGIIHANGEKIILNYTKESEEFVDENIASKKTNAPQANIVKGTLVS